jgi:hypothetical protein
MFGHLDVDVAKMRLAVCVGVDIVNVHGLTSQ